MRQLNQEPATMSLQQQIADWLADYATRAGADGYVIGLSGGVDSATAAALAVQAVGPKSVLAAILPCHSPPGDAVLAKRVAAALDVAITTVRLDEVFDEMIHRLPPTDHRLAAANVKPRLRMTALYYLAQSNNYLVVGGSNRSERMVGYFTKYGDGGADVLPLGDLYKTEVWELARELGLPAEVVERPPSAGLWPGQRDEDELGITYETLDRVLAAIAADDTDDIPAPTLRKVERMIASSAHKRTMPHVFERRREQ